jgi:hypothetical protein
MIAAQLAFKLFLLSGEFVKIGFRGEARLPENLPSQAIITSNASNLINHLRFQLSCWQ